VLRWRLLSAAVILSVLLALVGLDYRLAMFGVPGIWLLPVLLLVSVLATNELLDLVGSQGYRPVAWVLYAGNVLITLAACLPMLYGLAGRKFPAANPLGLFGWPLVVLALAAAAVLVAEMQRFKQPGRATLNSTLGVFTLVYVGLLGSFLALLRQHGDNGRGMAALISMLLIVKVADAGAYFVGKTFGRTKVTPLLSPGKTWEGAIGGFLAAAFASWAFFRYLAPLLVTSGSPKPTLAGVLAYGIILAAAGMIGDLAESMMKRDMQRKDSSTWVPGLGGVLDIIDAILIAAPVAWLCWEFGMLG
jgi:phosphatidate cytidylyltransferase